MNKSLFFVKWIFITVVAGITFQWSDVDGSFVLDENMEDFDLSGMVVNCSPNDPMIDNESADEKAEEVLDFCGKPKIL